MKKFVKVILVTLTLAVLSQTVVYATATAPIIGNTDSEIVFTVAVPAQPVEETETLGEGVSEPPAVTPESTVLSTAEPPMSVLDIRGITAAMFVSFAASVCLIILCINNGRKKNKNA